MILVFIAGHFWWPIQDQFLFFIKAKQSCLFVFTIYTLDSLYYLFACLVHCYWEAVCLAILTRNSFQAEKIIIIFIHFFCLINFLSWCLSIPGMCVTLLTQDYAEQVRNLQKIKEKLEIALEKHQDCTYFFPVPPPPPIFLGFKWNNCVWLSF